MTTRRNRVDRAVSSVRSDGSGATFFECLETTDKAPLMAVRYVAEEPWKMSTRWRSLHRYPIRLTCKQCGASSPCAESPRAQGSHAGSTDIPPALGHEAFVFAGSAGVPPALGREASVFLEGVGISVALLLWTPRAPPRGLGDSQYRRPLRHAEAVDCRSPLAEILHDERDASRPRAGGTPALPACL